MRNFHRHRINNHGSRELRICPNFLRSSSTYLLLLLCSWDSQTYAFHHSSTTMVSMSVTGGRIRRRNDSQRRPQPQPHSVSCRELLTLNAPSRTRSEAHLLVLFATPIDDPNHQPLSSPPSMPPPSPSSKSTQTARTSSTFFRVDEWMFVFQLVAVSLIASVMMISWEDVSMYHPMRISIESSSSSSASSASATTTVLSQRRRRTRTSNHANINSISNNDNNRWGQSTVRGLGFGRYERNLVRSEGDLESNDFNDLKSYNEVMDDHRTNRVPSFFFDDSSTAGAVDHTMDVGTSLWNRWRTTTTNRNTGTSSIRTISEQDVVSSIEQLKSAIMTLQDCKQLAKEYEWEQLRTSINSPTLRDELNNACYILKHANNVLPSEVRDVVGFDWGSCAWRHCGALADIQESLDELEASLGVLEPYEALFCLDVVERSVRDMADAMPPNLIQKTDQTINIPKYEPLKRMSDVSEEDRVDGTDRDYLEALEFLRSTEP
mmetsp:Transcript_28291/g.68831  ORF Transcript_28291/g.68831 Transcript_28291/m.68831 type:complete len:491 (+) Transcript_28291:295-1767(+)